MNKYKVCVICTVAADVDVEAKTRKSAAHKAAKLVLNSSEGRGYISASVKRNGEYSFHVLRDES